MRPEMYQGYVAGKEIKSFKWGELDEVERARICHNFTEGDKVRQELYSPLYNGTSHYPNNTECTRVIRAPYNHMVRLDFRDRFHLEESPTCEFDYLEIRNGAYAYSPLEARLCGDTFPKPVQSEGRHLWLKFASDASIEYTGFKAVYTFKPAPSKLVFACLLKWAVQRTIGLSFPKGSSLQPCRPRRV
ncbi:hypothetical protein HPB48_015569 [Haemaphysalis longicornis]|uniref:CUB domain-containing protein n=1 Tax=Haemaphysalis longicornis TaxID=44386 RepID=A0A9J6FHM7_HAELO|nr:hypothetical protein HPB48_015569 [Haemaphysalis longicornis]